MGTYDRDFTRIGRTEAAIGSFSSRVYGWLSIGLALTALVAYFIYQSGAYLKLLPFWWVLAFGTLGIAMVINFAIKKISIPTMAMLYLAYAGLEGVFFGTILPAFAAAHGGQVIWSAFATAAGVFGIAMAYGIFTKSDLTRIGKILTFALIGLIAVSLIYLVLSFFINVTWFNLIISYLGLVIFVGLTAYDAQQIRYFSLQAEANSVASYKLSLMMSLKMYINVIMIFWYLLQIFSSNRNN